MNAVWNSYGQLCGYPEIFKKVANFFVVGLTYGCRRLWKCTGGRSCAARKPGNHVVTVLGSMGAPFHLVNNRSFSTVLPSISTLRTHSEPILNRSAF